MLFDLFTRRRRYVSLRRLPAHLRRDIGLTDVAPPPGPRWSPFSR